MKVSGKDVAQALLKKLEKEIKTKNLKPSLAIILAGNDPSSRIYVANKLKTAKRIGIKAGLYEFLPEQLNECLKALDRLNKDPKVHGVIIQHPVYPGWNYDDLLQRLNPKKDVDGFLENSPYLGATALAVWEMLTAFALVEGFPKTELFLRNKKIIVLGRGKTAGAPTTRLLKSKGFNVQSLDRQTLNPIPIIKSGDVIISATGQKNIVNKHNLKKGAYVVAVGYGDINESEVSKIAKLYNPNIGGIGPLTIVSLLKNVVESARRVTYGTDG